jgi:acyl transferase domain-containing protein
VRHGLIPPNLHFSKLNPKIKKFYGRLEVPRRLEPWPGLPPGAPRRASVNSFGFGGMCHGFRARENEERASFRLQVI